MLRLVQVVERFSSPRLIRLVRAPAMRVVIGLIICALACSMLLPIPGTNTAPAFGIFLIGFSLLEDDGVLLLAGILCSLLALFISLLIIFFGYKSYVWLKENRAAFFLKLARSPCEPGTACLLPRQGCPATLPATLPCALLVPQRPIQGRTLACQLCRRKHSKQRPGAFSRAPAPRTRKRT